MAQPESSNAAQLPRKRAKYQENVDHGEEEAEEDVPGGNGQQQEVNQNSDPDFVTPKPPTKYQRNVALFNTCLAANGVSLETKKHQG